MSDKAKKESPELLAARIAEMRRAETLLIGRILAWKSRWMLGKLSKALYHTVSVELEIEQGAMRQRIKHLEKLMKAAREKEVKET